MTSAAVAVNADSAAELRAHVAQRFSKWSCSSVADASDMVDLLCTSAAGMAVCSFVKAEPAWSNFWKAAQPLQAAIVKQDRSSAGFVKPANAVRFALFNYAFTVAMAHAVAASRAPTARDSSGRKMYERTIICDSDLQGDENIEVFEYRWRRSDERQPLVNQLGLHFSTREVRVSTEQEDPLLLLADLVAGIGQSAHVPNPGRIAFPVNNSDCRQLLEKLLASGRAAIIDEPFSFRYEEMFSDAHAAATG